MVRDRRLEEREKELTCVYSICLLAAGVPEPEEAAEGVARALRAAMWRGSAAYCSIELALPETGRTVSVHRGPGRPSSRPSASSIEAELPDEASGGWTGRLRLEYRDGGFEFVPQEKDLLDSVAVILAYMLRSSELIAKLRAASKDVSAKNVALREVLYAIEDERRRMVAAFRDRLAAEIIPLAERARDPSLTKEKRLAYLDLLVDELGREATSLGPRPAEYSSLSPREREIAVQVRNGRTSKEIAELLGISGATVERHRHNIRRKLGAADRSVNLAGLLDESAAMGAPPASARDAGVGPGGRRDL